MASSHSSLLDGPNGPAFRERAYDLVGRTEQQLRRRLQPYEARRILTDGFSGLSCYPGSPAEEEN